MKRISEIITLKTFLESCNLMNNELKMLIKHMNIGECKLVDVAKVCEISLDGNISVNKLVEKIKSCNLSNPNADEKLYVELSRLGLKEVKKHYVQHANYNSSENNSYVDLYDDFIDEINDLENSSDKRLYYTL